MSFETGSTFGYDFEKNHETDIYINLNLDGTGKSKIETGIAFFDHMLDQMRVTGKWTWKFW
jgi:imidazoleglycerol phosphate dehydratase HisB